jgi:hypothetical protein
MVSIGHWSLIKNIDTHSDLQCPSLLRVTQANEFNTIVMIWCGKHQALMV